MKRGGIDHPPIYPESRACKRPTTEHILRLFSLAQRHTVLADGRRRSGAMNGQATAALIRDKLAGQVLGRDALAARRLSS